MQKKREEQQVEKPTKPEATPKPGAKAANPSQQLATLLRKESWLVTRVEKAKEDLKAVQDEIHAAWGERAIGNRELLSDDLEV